MSRLRSEAIKEIMQAGYLPTDEPSQSDGTHLTRYGAAFHARCENVPPCCPNRNGALIGKDHEGESGFGTLPGLLTFLAQAFPEHKGHLTHFIVPGSVIEG